MRLHLLTCGTELPDAAQTVLRDLEFPVTEHSLPPVPTRRDLTFIRDAAKEVLPVDDCPTEAEIRQRPDVPHQGSPERAPQQPSEPLRLVVFGADAALAAVAGQLTKWGLLWVEVAFVPVVHSVAATNWGLNTDIAAATRIAATGDVQPVPLIRDENGHAIVGYAQLLPAADADDSPTALTGEVWVDQAELFSGTTAGVQVRPLIDAPGLVAAEIAEPQPAGWPAKLRHKTVLRDVHGKPRQPRRPLTGRAVQAGSPGFTYIHDGVAAKKPLERVTIYRHLFDLQLVR
ncbi:hypothetical protein [Corynebacterium ulceribovis]|uniref:hypothetical protein n=1 Tax=Corynebacterium ulceribovis TaxID=487732 RepID=UPI0003645BA2|nr:hypothetical protein [Corynebacterium ulceribovis]